MAELKEPQNGMHYFLQVYRKSGAEARKGLLSCVELEINNLQMIKEGFKKIDEELPAGGKSIKKGEDNI